MQYVSAGAREGRLAWLCITLGLRPQTLVAPPGLCLGTSAGMATCGIDSYVKVAKNKTVDLRDKLISEASDNAVSHRQSTYWQGCPVRTWR